MKRKASVDRHRIVVVDAEYMPALALVDAVIVTVAFAIRTKQKRVLVVALGTSNTVVNFGKFFLSEPSVPDSTGFGQNGMSS